MKKFIKGILIISLISSFSLGGCTNIRNIDNDPPDEEPVIDTYVFGGSAAGRVAQVYDKETGVYYIVTSRGGISVMYNEDGTIKTINTDDDENNDTKVEPPQKEEIK